MKYELTWGSVAPELRAFCSVQRCYLDTLILNMREVKFMLLMTQFIRHNEGSRLYLVSYGVAHCLFTEGPADESFADTVLYT